MNRRGFLKLLGMGVVALAVSGIVEPIEPVSGSTFTLGMRDTFRVGDVFTIQHVYAINPTSQSFIVTGVVGSTITAVES